MVWSTYFLRLPMNLNMEGGPLLFPPLFRVNGATRQHQRKNLHLILPLCKGLSTIEFVMGITSDPPRFPGLRKLLFQLM